MKHARKVRTLMPSHDLAMGKRASQSRLRAFGFTLIELLVVISIVTMLAAIMLPVLGRAKDAAKNASCVGNQRQIGLAVHMYAGDWDGILPYGPNMPMPGDVARKHVGMDDLWTLADAYEDGVPPGTIQERLDSYSGGRHIYHCPGDAGLLFGKIVGSSYNYFLGLPKRLGDANLSLSQCAGHAYYYRDLYLGAERGPVVFVWISKFHGGYKSLLNSTGSVSTHRWPCREGQHPNVLTFNGSFEDHGLGVCAD